MGGNIRYTKDYLGIVFPIAISSVGASLMALVSAKTAGNKICRDADRDRAVLVSGLRFRNLSLVSQPLLFVVLKRLSIIYELQGQITYLVLMHCLVWLKLYEILSPSVSEVAKEPTKKHLLLLLVLPPPYECCLRPSMATMCWDATNPNVKIRHFLSRIFLQQFREQLQQRVDHYSYTK